MPENQQFIFTTGSHDTYHKSIARDQEDTENRQDKEGEKEIDLKRAEAVKERALKRLEKKDSATNIRRAEVALEKAINRIRVANH